MSNIGKVKWFNPNKGYGFITPEDESKDIFVHSSALEKSSIRILIEGQKVSYNIAKNKGRTSAVNIKIIIFINIWCISNIWMIIIRNCNYERLTRIY